MERGQSWLYFWGGEGNERRLTSKSLAQKIDSERVRFWVKTFKCPLLSESRNIKVWLSVWGWEVGRRKEEGRRIITKGRWE